MAKDRRNVKFVTILVCSGGSSCGLSYRATQLQQYCVWKSRRVVVESLSLYECIIGKKLQHQQATAEFLVQKFTSFIGVTHKHFINKYLILYMLS